MTDTTLTDELGAMRRQIEASSPLIVRCTTDASAIVPARGQVHAWLQPPDIQWDQWDEWTTTYQVVLVAGTTATQDTAARLLLDAITDMQHSGVNLVDATTGQWKRADAGGTVGAYILTVTPSNSTANHMEGNDNG